MPTIRGSNQSATSRSWIHQRISMSTVCTHSLIDHPSLPEYGSFRQSPKKPSETPPIGRHVLRLNEGPCPLACCILCCYIATCFCPLPLSLLHHIPEEASGASDSSPLLESLYERPDGAGPS